MLIAHNFMAEKRSARDALEDDGAAAKRGPSTGDSGDVDSHRIKVAVVCSSNQNRSMEAHAFLRCGRREPWIGS